MKSRSNKQKYLCSTANVKSSIYYSFHQKIFSLCVWPSWWWTYVSNLHSYHEWVHQAYSSTKKPSKIRRSSHQLVQSPHSGRMSDCNRILVCLGIVLVTLEAMTVRHSNHRYQNRKIDPRDAHLVRWALLLHWVVFDAMLVKFHFWIQMFVRSEASRS